MLDLLASVVALAVVVGVVALLGLALTVMPFVVATVMAERRGLSAARVGALTLLAVGVGLAAGLLVLRGDLPVPYALLTLLLCWAVPGTCAVLGPRAARLGGRRGLHE